MGVGDEYDAEQLMIAQKLLLLGNVLIKAQEQVLEALELQQALLKILIESWASGE